MIKDNDNIIVTYNVNSFEIIKSFKFLVVWMQYSLYLWIVKKLILKLERYRELNQIENIETKGSPPNSKKKKLYFKKHVTKLTILKNQKVNCIISPLN